MARRKRGARSLAVTALLLAIAAWPASARGQVSIKFSTKCAYSVWDVYLTWIRDGVPLGPMEYMGQCTRDDRRIDTLIEMPAEANDVEIKTVLVDPTLWSECRFGKWFTPGQLVKLRTKCAAWASHMRRVWVFLDQPRD